MYGAVSLFKVNILTNDTGLYRLRFMVQKYVKPHLRPPSSTAYEADRDALSAQFDAAEAMLKEIQAETNVVRLAVEEQKEKIEKTTQEVKTIVSEMRDSEEKTRTDLREMKDEVQHIREMVPKVRIHVSYAAEYSQAFSDDRKEQGGA